MSEPYYSDDTVTLWHGDSLEVLSGMAAQSVDCCVTSPPYFGLRDYGSDGQYGLEASPAEYVETMRAVFAEVRRVLAGDGTLWLNIGDSYSGSAKNLMGMPWRVAFALQDDGWILRNAIIWHKPNAMPESVTDRLSTRYEQVFMFSKSRRYWFDLDPIREPIVSERTGALSWERDAAKERDLPGARVQKRPGRTWDQRKERGAQPRRGIDPASSVGDSDFVAAPQGRNPGDVWTIATQPFREAHFAVMPTALAERCIQAGCKPSGVVLDPFSGSGTTGLAAGKHGHPYVGIDLNSEYLDLSLRTRLAQASLIDGEAS
jgi:site-specific DNA-methyltransferase (cytosine-N4-specific)